MSIEDIKKIIVESYDKNRGLPGDGTTTSSILYEPNFSSISQILTNASFLFYEFEDKNVKYCYEGGLSELGEYTREVSPLFITKVVNSESNNELLNIIGEEVPLYYIQPEVSAQLNSSDLQDTRDCGVNNAHSALQDNSFYQIWLRDVFGSIQNQLVLNSYNKLRWPVIGENQYIMADLFPSLAMKAFRERESNTTDTLIEFRETTEENTEDNEFHEIINGEESELHTKIGCIDYLNSVVKEKLSSAYDILDYHPGKREIITSWGDSLYESGRIEEGDLEKQLIIYKLQDTKYELLKRKYAGTKTLYTIALRALDRQGSTVLAVPLSSTQDDDKRDLYFVDKRLIRILNIPGVTTSREVLSYFPLKYLTKKENSPSINDVVSLYYNSGENYNAENFYEEEFIKQGDSIISSPGSVKDLRRNIKYLNWNCLLGLQKGQAVEKSYNTLDAFTIDSSADAGLDSRIYWKLDDSSPGHLKDEDGNSIKKDGLSVNANYTFLDYTKGKVEVSSNTSIKDLIDISADRILFNSNSLQKEQGREYSYPTYRIASGNSISLMDTDLMSYLQTTIEEKSRVQEDIFYGVQLNKYQEIHSDKRGIYTFFAISYGENEEAENVESILQESGEYNDSSKFAYLWYCTVKYSVSTHLVEEFDRKVISKITLQIISPDSGYEDIEEYQDLCSFSKGIIPFTYFKVSDDSILNLKYDGITDHLKEAGYNKAYYLFSDNDFVSSTIPEGSITYTELLEKIDSSEYLKCRPSKDTKTIFYIVKKGEDNYAWSSPLKVFQLKDINLKEKEDLFYPDWYEECYFLNPYLNFTENSASPLRHKKVYTTEKAQSCGLSEISDAISGNIYLSNLVRFRGKDFLCCDKGEERSEWVSLVSEEENAAIYKYRGFYLDRVEPADEVIGKGVSAVAIYGDPRFINPYDSYYDSILDGDAKPKNRGEIRVNNQGINYLSFESEITGEDNQEEDYQFEYLKLVPGGVDAGEETGYTNWWWNKNQAGMFIAMNISLNFRNSNFDLYKDPILLQRKGEFCLSLKTENNSKYKVIFEYGEFSIESEEFDLTENNIRIGAGTTEDARLLVVVNGKAVWGDIIESLRRGESSSKEPIYLGINLEEGENSSISYNRCFLGKIYDLRLYNKGFSPVNAILVAGGSFRELYSYSSDLYILGYNNYIDLGIFKEVSEEESLGSKNNVPLIEDIVALRAFNRSVWDSILVDMCPITEEEEDPSSPYYRKDIYDPKSDTDIYGWVNGDKTFKDCVELQLTSFESLNNASIKGTDGDITEVKYNGNTIEVDEKDLSTIVTSMIYPVSYKEDLMLDSNSTLFERNGDTISTVEGTSSADEGLLLPQAFLSSDGNIKYEADFSLNFTIDEKSDFTNFYSKGSNIDLIYSKRLDKPVVIRKEGRSVGSEANHLLIPLTVPKQLELTIDDTGYLDKLYLSNVELNSGINTLLRATSYYNELRIPVAMDVMQDNSIGTIYASKWDAIRTLKEGTYYITCKYPFQILPFVDSLYDSNSKAKYDYLSASVRFKIEVWGQPVVYENGKNGAEDITSSYKEKYNKENIISTLRSTSALVDPPDNRTFPHRKINIDLYVQDCSGPAGRMIAGSDNSAVEGYSYYWKLLGTNHPNDYKSSGDWILLTKQKLENSLAITSKIPAFFSKNITSPFFIAKSEKTATGTRVNSLSADDDLIDPIRINPVYGSSKITSYIKADGVCKEGISYYNKDGDSYYPANPQPEEGSDARNYYLKFEGLDRLQVQNEGDLDNLVLVAGRSYKILWDYTGYTSEVSFTDSIYSQSTKAQLQLINPSKDNEVFYYLEDSEKTSYARLSSLLNLENTSEYLYNEDGTGYSSLDTQLSGKTNGYQVSNGEYTECYECALGEEDTLDANYMASWLTNPRTITIGSNNYTCLAEATLSSLNIVVVPQESYIPETSKRGTLYWIKEVDKYYTSKNEEVEVTVVDDLSETTWGSLGVGSYYKTLDSDVVYKMGIRLENVVFKEGDNYRVWNYYEALSVNIAKDVSYENSSYCPAVPSKATLYPSRKEKIYFRYVNSNGSHFTEMSSVQDESTYNNEPFFFGNPYSRSSKNNYLLKIRNKASSYSRANIINSWYFPYTPTEIPEGQYLSSELLTPSMPLEVKISEIGDVSRIAIDEKDILAKQHQAVWSSAKAAIQTLINGNGGSSQDTSCGIFTALSTISPNYYFPSSKAQSATYVREVDDELVSYLASSRTYPSKNENITITRRGLYSNNLLSCQDLDNAAYWTWGNASNLLNEGQSSEYNLYTKEYVSDEDWDEGLGKDVCEVTYKSFGDGQASNSKDPLTIKYSGGATSIGAVYETALNIKVNSDTYDSVEKKWITTAPKYYKWVEVTQEDASAKMVLTDITNNVSYLDYYPDKASNLVVVKKEALEAKGYLGSNVAGEMLNLKQWENRGELELGDTLGPDEISNKEELLKDLYVDSQANDVTVYATFLSNGVRVGDPVRLYVTSLSQQQESVSGLAAFDDQWYTLSAEPSTIVVADSIAFEFICEKPVKFRLTKAVVRKSEAKTHALGLIDGLFTKRTSSKNAVVTIASHHCIAYRNISTRELIPVQFNAFVGYRPSTSSYTSEYIPYAQSGLTELADFRNAYSLGYEASNKRVERLMSPWKRKFLYKRNISSNIQKIYFDPETGKIYENYRNGGAGKGYIFSREIAPQEGVYYYFINGSNEKRFYLNSDRVGATSPKYESYSVENGNYYNYSKEKEEFLACELPFVQTAYFHKYEIKKKSTGVREEVENALSTEDIYLNPSETNLAYIEGAERASIQINDLRLNKEASSFLKRYNTNLQITAGIEETSRGKIIKAGPISVSNIRVSALANCFDREKYRNGEDSKIAITNLQLIGQSSKAGEVKKKVLFEIEYPPVILNEKDYHLACNIYLHKKVSEAHEGI